MHDLTIKIEANTPELFNETLTSVMNIACVSAMKGYIPSENDISDDRSGRYWKDWLVGARSMWMHNANKS